MPDHARSRMWRNLTVAAVLAFAPPCVLGVAAAGQDPQPLPPPLAPSAPADTKGDAAQRSSPWLLAPLVSSSPKLGTSFGALGAYLHTFDPLSRVSLFGVNYQYTSTDSSIAAVFARMSMGADHHRIV